MINILKYTKLCINHSKIQSTTLLSNQINLLIQQTRNTFILKRRYPPALHKKNHRPQRLKAKNFVYDLVKHVDSQKSPCVDIILLQDMKNIGFKGQKLSIPSEKAHVKYLLPKLAVYATPENCEKYLINENADLKQSIFLEGTINLLSQCYLSVVMNLHNPWIIKKWHIRASFRKAGFIVPDDAIELPNKPIQGPNLAIENKEFYVIVTINNEEKVTVRCKIHHWKYDTDTNAVKFLSQPSIAIFPEDQAVLDSLPKHRLC